VAKEFDFDFSVKNFDFFVKICLKNTIYICDIRKTILSSSQYNAEELAKLRLEMINDIIMDLITEHNYGELIPVNKG